MLNRKNSLIVTYAPDAPQLLYVVVEALIEICLSGKKDEKIPSPPLTDKQYEKINEYLLSHNLTSPSKSKIEQKMLSFNTRFNNASKALDYYKSRLDLIQNPEVALNLLVPSEAKKEDEHLNHVCIITCYHLLFDIY